jgi:hypothetical protein
VYLRESSRRNKDGSKVTYLQLAHNERHPKTGVAVAKVIHNFGRADKVDKVALARLVSSISRILDLPTTSSSAAASDVEIVDSRRLGGAFVLDQLWDRLGIADALRSSAKGRRIDGDLVERICFALVAQRCLEPASKLAAVRWAQERVATCFDNSVAESFRSSLKREFVHRYRFATRAHARAAITAWIKRYNAVRLHSTLGYVPPVEWELHHRLTQLQAA